MAPMTGMSGFTSPDHQRRYLRAYDEAMALCPEPAGQFDVDTRYGTTRIYRFGPEGAGPPIVLLPGLLATAAGCWQVLPTLSQRHAVYVVDTLGEGGASVQRPLH